MKYENLDKIFEKSVPKRTLPIKDYDSEINELNQKIKKYSEYVELHPEKIGVKGNIKTLIYIRDELVKERNQSMQLTPNEEVNLHLEGKDIKNHSIYAPLFSELINVIMDMSTFFSAAIRYGVKGMYKHIDANFKRETGYFIKTSPGSFKITFYPTVHEDNQSTFSYSLNKQFFDKLCELINLGENISILDQVNMLGSDSVMKYKKFIEILDRNELDMTIDDGNENPIVILNHNYAHQINNTFKEFNEDNVETEEISIKGTIYSINTDYKQFGIKFFDKELGKTIKIPSIKFREGFKLKVKNNVDAEVEVILEKTTKNIFSEDNVKVSYDLLEIND
ncbi:MAG: hypothetical protein IJP99_00535 [Methanobrevibacter sp.]|nr:hypothetical protein [Methanobrevibacter sp.]